MKKGLNIAAILMPLLVVQGCPVTYHSTIRWTPSKTDEFPVIWGEQESAEVTQSSAPSSSGKRKFVVAVFDIEDQGKCLSPNVVLQLSEYLAARLAETGVFQVVPREQVRMRLVQEKVESYKECYDQSCQIQIGKAIAADKSLATKLLKVGVNCALTSTLYDLETETSEAGASVRSDCSENALMDGIDMLVKQLVTRP